MNYLQKAKQLYDNKEYDDCLDLLYKNNTKTKLIVWSIILFSFLIDAIAIYVFYEINRSAAAVVAIVAVAVAGAVVVVAAAAAVVVAVAVAGVVATDVAVTVAAAVAVVAIVAVICLPKWICGSVLKGVDKNE